MLSKQDVIKYTSSLTLLFVEDNKQVRESAQFLLEDIFKNIISAVDGQDGIDKFKNNNIDVVITDIDMPVMNGMEMIEKIREIDRDIPIVILSALMRTEYFIQSIKLGVRSYLLKPLDSSSLFDSLEGITTKIQLRDEMLENMKLKERMEHALLGSNNGLWDWNIITNEVHFSPRWKEIIGYSDDEIPSEFSTWEERVHSDDIELTMADIQDNISGKTDYFENVHRLKHKDGHWVWILDRGKTIYDETGKPIRMIGTHTDITDSKQTEIELNKKNTLLQKHIDIIEADKSITNNDTFNME